MVVDFEQAVEVKAPRPPLAQTVPKKQNTMDASSAAYKRATNQPHVLVRQAISRAITTATSSREEGQLSGRKR